MSRHLLSFPPLRKAEIECITERIGLECHPSFLSEIGYIDIERFLEFYMPKTFGFDYHYTDSLPYGVHAATDFSSRMILINSNLIEDPSNGNFLRSTIAHEIGHCVLHTGYIEKRKISWKSAQNKNDADGFKLYRGEEIPICENPEWQAWHFAKAILMPREPLLIALNKGCGEEELSKIFQVNPIFVKNRLKTL